MMDFHKHMIFGFEAATKLCRLTVLVLPIVFLFGCASPAGPDDDGFNPSVEKVEYYDYTVTYIRPAGSIASPDEDDPLIFYISNKHNTMQRPYLTKVNDYEFTGSLTNWPTHLESEASIYPNRICILDMKRWTSEVYQGGIRLGKPYTVGDIIKLKNLSTDVELTLTNIKDGSLVTCPVPLDEKIAYFWTIKGGVMANTWPY